MKKYFPAFSLAAALSCITLPTSANAELTTEGLYFKGDVGAVMMADTELKEFFGPVSPDTDVKFDLGWRGGVGVGYSFNPWFAAEIEFGFMGASIDKITGASVADADLGIAPFLLNAKLQLPTGTLVTPYVGAGVGGAAVWLDAEEINLEGTTVWGTESTAVFAYQLFAGLRFRITEKVDLGIEYRYTGAEDAEFESDWGLHGSNERVKLGRLEAHSVSLAVNVRF